MMFAFYRLEHELKTLQIYNVVYFLAKSLCMKE